MRAVCSCGWRSPVFGDRKTAGTMDPLQQAMDAGDLHEWEIPVTKFPPALDRTPTCVSR